MDTWATSSLTPQIAGGWIDDPDLFARVFPMDLRPQAHEIISTWLFGTVVRSHLEHDVLPWRHAAISGWILDPDRKKMSKSKGNVVTPAALFEQYGADAVRYWAASARPGVDTAFDEGQMRIGRKLATKILNVTKFVLSVGDPPADARRHRDARCAMLARVAGVVDEATMAFDAFDYARALERTEELLLVVLRRLRRAREEPGLRRPRRRRVRFGPRAALRLALRALHRLFAPIMPFVTDEVWSWWQDGSIHVAAWPTAGELSSASSGTRAELGEVLDAVGEVLSHVRRAKTEAKVSQRSPVERVEIAARPSFIDALRRGEGDLRDAGGIADLVTVETDDDPKIGVALATNSG